MRVFKLTKNFANTTHLLGAFWHLASNAYGEGWLSRKGKRNVFVIPRSERINAWMDSFEALLSPSRTMAKLAKFRPPAQFTSAL